MIFLQKLIVVTVNEHKNFCMAGLNRQAGYVTVSSLVRYHVQYTERLVHKLSA